MNRILALLFVALLLNTAYIAAFAEASIFYMGNVLMHVVLGVIVFILALKFIPNWQRLLALLVAATGAYLTVMGATTPNQKILWTHIAVGVLAAIAAALTFPRVRTAVAVLTLAGLGLALRPVKEARIVNPEVVPLSMEEEGDGPKSPFWPSSSTTNVKTTIPSDFFMDSKLCGECHKDI